MENHIPPQPPQSFRVVLDLVRSEKRLDNILLLSLKAQKENLNLRILTRGAFKKLFSEGRIQIKGQRARPSSSVNKGFTYVDILGY
jgi:ribosomal 50S subunit-recycling heat shock protein